MAIMPDMTRHSRRHKSVGGGSRRVDEATTTVFREFDEGSKHNDSLIKTGTTGMVRIGDLQSFHRAFAIEKIRVSLGDSKMNDLAIP